MLEWSGTSKNEKNEIEISEDLYSELKRHVCIYNPIIKMSFFIEENEKYCMNYYEYVNNEIKYGILEVEFSDEKYLDDFVEPEWIREEVIDNEAHDDVIVWRERLNKDRVSLHMRVY